MSARVNVLLLLSALFSVLTGVGGHARQPQQASAVVQQVRATAVRTAAAEVVVRPQQTRLTLQASAAAPLTRALSIAVGIPLYATRLRE